jgi:hypothetical protein
VPPPSVLAAPKAPASPKVRHSSRQPSGSTQWCSVNDAQRLAQQLSQPPESVANGGRRDAPMKNPAHRPAQVQPLSSPSAARVLVQVHLPVSSRAHPRAARAHFTGVPSSSPSSGPSASPSTDMPVPAVSRVHLPVMYPVCRPVKDRVNLPVKCLVSPSDVVRLPVLGPSATPQAQLPALVPVSRRWLTDPSCENSQRAAQLAVRQGYSQCGSQLVSSTDPSASPSSGPSSCQVPPQ